MARDGPCLFRKGVNNKATSLHCSRVEGKRERCHFSHTQLCPLQGNHHAFLHNRIPRPHPPPLYLPVPFILGLRMLCDLDSFFFLFFLISLWRTLYTFPGPTRRSRIWSHPCASTTTLRTSGQTQAYERPDRKPPGRSETNLSLDIIVLSHLDALHQPVTPVTQ